MKKIFSYFSILSILFIFASCTQNVGEDIIGSWNNTTTEVSKLDEVSSALLSANKDYLSQQKDMYEAQMASMDDSSKMIYEQIITSIDEQIASLNIDTVKANIIKNYDIGTFVFNADSSLIIKAGQDSVIGSWSLADENKTLNIMIQSDQIPLTISEVSKSKLVLVQETSIDSLEFAITYTFEK